MVSLAFVRFSASVLTFRIQHWPTWQGWRACYSQILHLSSGSPTHRVSMWKLASFSGPIYGISHPRRGCYSCSASSWSVYTLARWSSTKQFLIAQSLIAQSLISHPFPVLLAALSNPSKFAVPSRIISCLDSYVDPPQTPRSATAALLGPGLGGSQRGMRVAWKFLLNALSFLREA